MIIREKVNQMRKGKRKTGGMKERHITAVVKMNQRKEERETKERGEGAPVAVKMMRE